MLKNIAIAVVMICSVFFVAGCSKHADTSQVTESKMTTIKVGYIPIADCAQLYAGIEQGFFKEEGINIELVRLAGGAKILEAMASDAVDVGFSNLVSLILANNAGLNFKAISGGPVVDIDHPETAIVALKSSQIDSIKDLEGKTVAVNTRKNIVEIMLRELMEINSVDVASVTFREIPFPKMESALVKGQVDAISLFEPFVSFARNNQNTKVISPFFSELYPTIQVSSYNATEHWLNSNNELRMAFKNAISKATHYLLKNPDASKALVAKYTSLSLEQVEGMQMPTFSDSVNMESLNKLIQLAEKNQWVKAGTVPSQLVFE